MSIYLEDIPLDEALDRWFAAIREAGQWAAMPGELVSLDAALGRVTAEPVWARISSPHYHAAAMDGYAVRAASTSRATETRPVRLQLPDDAAYVDTGDPLPQWADAVIPIEVVQAVGLELAPRSPEAIDIRAGVPPWTHVRALGEDMVATELVLPANHRIRPVDLGALAGSGHSAVSVRRKPRVAVIPTGDELVAIGSAVRAGDIIEYNSLVLAAQVAEWGGATTRWPIVPDDPDALIAAVNDAAANHDLVLLNAGSSRGSGDFSAEVIGTCGEVLVHGIAVRPGHPVVLGLLDRDDRRVPVIGVPGYPVSAALTGEIFVAPLLANWLGQQPPGKPVVEATLTRKLLSPIGDDDYVRVTVGQVGERTVATPLSRGAGVISSLVRADGLVLVPRFSEGLTAGSTVQVQLYRSPTELARTIVAIGSHDMTLDLLTQFLAANFAGLRLSSANVGSLGGLVALRRGEAHLAGAHLLDPATGDYNVSYVRQYLPDTPVRLVTLVGREQGLMVAPGNPKAITGLADLAREDMRFVNRQAGAGTRVLLDYELGKLGIMPEVVTGYDREEYTHLAVAAAVQSGVADCGLGIRAAAIALGLDFVPLVQERYELVIPTAYFAGDLLQPLFATLADPAFQAAVAERPGYDVSRMGQVRDVA